MEKEQTFTNHQELLFGLSKKLLNSQSVQQSADIIVKALYSHVKSFDCALFRFEPAHHQLICISYASRDTQPSFKLKPIMIGAGVVGHAAKNQETIVIADCKDCDYWLQYLDNTCSELTVPIMQNNQLLGVIDMEDERSDYFTDSHKELVESVASLTSIHFRQMFEAEELGDKLYQLQHHNQDILNKEAQQRAIIDNLVDPVFVLDNSCKIVDVNYSGSLLLGASKSELTGQKIQLFETTAEGASTFPYYKNATCHSSTILNVVYTPLGGAKKEYELAINRQSDNTYITSARETQYREDSFLELKNSREFLREVLKTTPDIVYTFDLVRDEFVLGQKRLSKLLGYSENYLSNWEIFLSLVHPDDLPKLLERGKSILQSSKGDVVFSEARLKHKSGKYLYLQNYAVVFSRADDGTPISEIGTVRNITERRELKKEIQRRDHYYKSLVENAFDGIALYDDKARLQFLSVSAQKLLGYYDKDIVGMHGLEFVHPEDQLIAKSAWEQLMSVPDNVVRIPEYRILKQNGESVWVENTLVNLSQDKDVRGVISNFRDISLRKLSEMSLHRLSYYDQLTELPNRSSLVKYLEQSLSSKSYNFETLSLIYFDIVKLHLINNAHGNLVGDEVIKQVSKTLESHSESFGFLSRAGDDEFAAVLLDADNLSITKIIEDIMSAYHNMVSINGHDVKITIRAGIVSYPQDAGNAEKLLVLAENTVKQLKRGTEPFSFYHQSETVNAKERFRLEKNIIHAIDLDQFSLAYQPVLSPHTGKVHYLEALLRWEHPELGYIPPDKIIDIAEESHLIHSLTDWVLESAIKQIKEWKTLGQHLKVAVNISPKDFLRDNLISTLKSLQETYGVSSNHIGIEVTESAAMIDTEKSKEILTQLKDMGIAIALDDFGTGYSSISLLANLPVAKVKVDKSFIDKLGQADPSHEHGVDNNVIVENILRLAKSFNLKSVVEGVETMEQIKLLMDYGCDYVQGYLYSKPLFPAELLKYLESHKVHQVTD